MAVLRPHRPAVVALRPRQSLRVDPEPLMRLRATAGPQAAALHVERARDVLAQWGQTLTLGATCADETLLTQRLAAIATVAAPIGLTDLVLVAGFARDSLAQGDRHAAAATLARLARLCQQALALTAGLNRNG